MYRRTIHKKDFYKKRVIVFLTVFLTLSSILISISVYLRAVSNDNRSIAAARRNGELVDLVHRHRPPVVVSIAPRVVYVGHKYYYPIRIEDPDTKINSLSIVVKRAPFWLKYSDFTLEGYPAREHVGEYEVEILIGDGYNTVNETFFIIVKSE